MGNAGSVIGCFALVLLIAVVALFQWLGENPAAIILVPIVVIAIIIIASKSKKNRITQLKESFLAIAEKLEALAKTKEEPANLSLSLKKGEKPLFALYNTSLTEYRSSGSTYSGTNAGVSLPIVGGVRGYVGGSSGSVTKNPEELTIVDAGTAIFTTQRIVFTGAQLVREWEFAKVLSLDIGENGQTVKIAVSNRDRTSGLQTPFASFGVGYPAGYAQTWFQEGEPAARKWLVDQAKAIRKAVAALDAVEPAETKEVK